jgi:hypothetical protein
MQAVKGAVRIWLATDRPVSDLPLTVAAARSQHVTATHQDWLTVVDLMVATREYVAAATTAAHTLLEESHSQWGRSCGGGGKGLENLGPIYF